MDINGSADGVRVCMLGRFSMEYKGKDIVFAKGNQQRSLQLLQMLILHKDGGIAKERLMEELYDWTEVGNKNNSLNNLIYRLRKQLLAAGLPGDDYVSVHNGFVVLNDNIPLWVDVEELEETYHRAEAAEDTEQKIACYRRVCELYCGEFLPQSAHESWVIIESVRLKKIYVASVQTLCKLLGERDEIQEMYRFYSQAANLYPFEDWQVGQMEGLMILGRYEEAYSLYKATEKLYMDELGVPPTENMLNCLRTMQKKVMLPEERLEQIQARMVEKQREHAYYCAFPTFVDAYRILLRLTGRDGKSIFLMSCTLQQIQLSKEKKNSERIEAWLREAICRSLRQGDICTRYSKNQFLMLLTGMKQEDRDVIVNRIRKTFGQDGGTEGYELSFALVSGMLDDY